MASLVAVSLVLANPLKEREIRRNTKAELQSIRSMAIADSRF